MISIEVIAVVLLIARLISVWFIVKVLLLQYRLFGTKIDFTLVPNLTKLQKRHIYLMRRILFTLSLIILLGNIIPIFIDIMTILPYYDTHRPATLHVMSIMYAFSNSVTAMLSAIMIWVLYQVAGFGNTNDR